jgi:NADPH:quinone reductase-like Zn-dependent oxidoreductase
MCGLRAKRHCPGMTIDTLPRTMEQSRRGDWAVSLGLVALGVIPAVGGAVRLASFGTGSVALADAPRFAAHPSVLAVHIVSALTFSLLGALQFAKGARRRSPSLHRAAGWLVAPAGVVAGLSGLATMVAYAPSPTAGPTLHALRILSGVAMIAFLALGLEALRRRDYRAHGAWMTRAYALGIAPGTQALALIPLTLALGGDTELTFTTGMAVGWLVNLAFAERVLRRRASNTTPPTRSVRAPSADSPRSPATDSMRAVVYDRYGGPEELRCERVARPIAREGQVLVRVEASSLNALDRRMLRADPFLVRLVNGLLRPRVRLLGADVAGVIEAVGPGVRDRAVGDRVFGDASDEGLGGFSEYVCLREGSVALIPEGLDALDAASLPLAARTALQAVRERARVRPGQRVLVWGAGGGVGTAVVQIAKAYGAHVTAVSGQRSVERARSLGADVSLDRTQPLALDPASFDAVFGVNGDEPLSEHLARLVPGGVYVMIGGGNRQLFESLILGSLRARAQRRRVEVLTMDPALIAQDLAELRALVARGALRPVIDRVVPLADVASAMQRLERGEAQGKIVLDVRGFGREA